MWRDSETELDFLDFNYLIKILEDTIKDEKLLPSSIGVYGDWGSGKSSLMNMCSKILDKEDGTTCLIFNGWLFEGYEDAKTAMLGSVLDAIGDNTKLTKKAKQILCGLNESVDKLKLFKQGLKLGTDLLLTNGIGTIVDLGIKSVLSKTGDQVSEVDFQKVKDNIDAQMNNKALREDIREFREKFADLLIESKIKKLVIFVDELDRCSPTTILDTLEAMRLFLFTGNVAFVIGADERHLSYAVKSKFKDIEGVQIDIGQEYLEKLIQYPIKIPRLNDSEVQYYIMCLLFQKNLMEKQFEKLIEYLNIEKEKDFMKFKVDYTLIESYNSDVAEKVQDSIIVAQQISGVLATGLNGNPRQCKRFLNTWDMRIQMAKYKKIELNVKILAKLMEAEYIKLSFFKKLAQLANENKLENEMKLLEEGKFNELTVLSAWKGDKWVEEWAHNEPMLSGEDLRVYFYFTRTSLDDRNNTLGPKLTGKGQEIYKIITSGGDAAFNKCLQEAGTLSEADATLILEKLFQYILEDDSLKSNKVERFLKWGLTKEGLYSEVIDDLKGIEGMKIGFGLIPLVGDFGRNAKMIMETDAIFDKWERENKSLSAALKLERERNTNGNIK